MPIREMSVADRRRTPEHRQGVEPNGHDLLL
jgi:hypothetical protein